MNQHLQNILNLIEQDGYMPADEKSNIIKLLKNINKELEVTSFKLDRTEKVKRTTAILLEETIEELEQKRKAVEAQNKELEIESSLERVRTVALSMKEPADMLQVCKVIATEINKLGVKEIRNVQTAIFYESKGTYMNYEYYAKHDKTIITETSYTNHKMHQAFAAQMLKGKGEFFTTYISKAELPDWISYQKTTNVFIDTYLETASSLNYYWFSLGPVALGISTYIPLTEEETNLFKRFRNVFELAYTRYLDIEQAIAQAREAQIEAALEKVRSRSLAVHKSDEFKEVIKVVFEKLQELGIIVSSVSINIFIEGSKDAEVYICGQNTGELSISHFRLVYFDHPISNDRFNAQQSGQDFFSKNYGFEEKNSFFKHLFEISDLKYMPDDIKKMVFESKAYTALWAFAKHSMIVVNDFEGKGLSEKEIDTVKRFSKVFEQAYIRFLDLQKAEAQARESQIELGLERVRARAMAMQTSEELNPLIGTVFTELTKLDILLTRCVILIYEGNEKGVRWWMANSETPSTPMNFFVKYADMPFFNEYFKGWYNRSLKWQYCLEGENKIKTDDFLFTETELSLLPDFVIAGMRAPDRVYLNASFNNFGNLTLASLGPLSEEHFNILLRFAKVFDLTYTRFNDLQKAEAQAREAQVELSLERVRAKTMAMHNSNDVTETVATLFDEVVKLGIETIRCGIVIMQEAGQMEVWTAKSNEEGKVDLIVGRLDMMMHPLLKGAYNSWQQKNEFYTYTLSGDDLRNYFTAINDHPDYPIKYDIASLPSKIIHSEFHFTEGSLFIFSLDVLPPETKKIFKRFASVFGQTYKRYLDLQKAEAQAREAQIEAALEKVRSRSLAVYKSDEFNEVIKVVFERLQELEIPLTSVSINVFIEGSKDTEAYICGQGEDGLTLSHIRLVYFNHPITNDRYDAYEKGLDFFTKTYCTEEKNSFYEYEFEVSDLKYIPADIKKMVMESQCYTCSVALTKNSMIVIHDFESKSLSLKEIDIIKRFSRVFEQAYIRFLDLQKAEAQSRESKIQLALERVRARTMAMQKSDELQEVVTIVYNRLTDLDIKIDSASVIVLSDKTDVMQFWVAVPGQPYSTYFEIPAFDNTTIAREFTQARESGTNFTKSYTGKEKNEQWNYLFEHSDLKNIPAERRNLLLETKAYTVSVSFTKNTALQLLRYDEALFSENENEIFQRFANVFEQAYIRFLDLQKSEAQAREAQIEVALERVRGKAMAMQNSVDLSVTASLVFTELRKLGINPIRCGVGLLNKESRKARLYSVASSSDGDSLSLIGWVMLSGHPVLEKIYDTWLKNEDYYPELTGAQLESYYKNLLAGLSLPTVPNWQTAEKQFGHFFSFSVGCLYTWSDRHYNDAEIKILKRFATIIDLTFRRYLDLQKAEANAKEAVKQSALDRIRADIASMRTTNDLDRITPLIWNELTILDIPFIRCGVFIMNDSEQCIHTFLSTPDGKAIAAFQIPYNTPGNIKLVISHWHNNKNYIDHWDENAFIEFAETLLKQGALISPDQYLKTIPHNGFYLHFLPFLQGMLYVGNTARLSDEEINLIQSVADAFSTAYARYEDFNKLEAAKQQVDNTLKELRSAQQQLIQSEKMASLGELTAGIAHEIQNPLNFVNNFSEVNEELIDELVYEFDKGNAEEVKAIANDIKQNLEKINHHGKRADAIVKGMLQHSRQTSGVKEPADINALCDEYLRLSFYGMRAKDKSFNADFKTDFDKSIGRINIVPQDIGRVLLNLFNNAFYATSEKLKAENEKQNAGYKQTVSLQTKKINDIVEIIVTDNGNGISQNIIDKIFQPFFTTKPTGQGTGLGLSLSYDIIKAHGGEIKVKNKEGEGCVFVISLPA